MKKTLITIAFLFLIIFSLIGCTSTDDTTKGNELYPAIDGLTNNEEVNALLKQYPTITVRKNITLSEEELKKFKDWEKPLKENDGKTVVITIKYEGKLEGYQAEWVIYELTELMEYKDRIYIDLCQGDIKFSLTAAEGETPVFGQSFYYGLDVVSQIKNIKAWFGGTPLPLNCKGCQ